MIAEAGRPARSRSPPTWPAAAWTSSSAATRSTSPSSSYASAASSRTRDEWDKAWDELFPKMEDAGRARTARRSWRPAASSSCGTERHESRRIDNQLRGRSGRQGDPGESRFYLSAEDDLVRLFAGDRIYRILDNKFLAQVDEDGQRAADRAQDALEADRGRPEEGRGAELPDPQARPRVRRRDEPAARDHLRVPRPRSSRARTCRRSPREQIARRDRADRARVHGRATSRRTGTSTRLFTQLEQIYDRLLRGRRHQGGHGPRDAGRRSCARTSIEAYDEREEELGDELMRALERFMLLQIIDERWREHLHDMDYLREGIHLRGFAQIDPLVAYKNEGFDMFTRAHEQHLGRVRALHLQRRGADRGAAAGGRRARSGAAAPNTTRDAPR